jgi:hypothetical protein
VIELLESYEHYEIGLATTTPELEPNIKSTVQAMLRGTPQYEVGEKNEGWGPQCMLY